MTAAIDVAVQFVIVINNGQNLFGKVIFYENENW